VTRVYGWKPDLPDKRDHYLQLDHVDAGALPTVFSLRDKMPPVWDQGSLGACTAFALGGAVAYERYLQNHAFKPSFLQLYYNERAVEGTVSIDAGAYIRDGAKVAAQCGVAPDSLWPYVESKFAQKPPKSVQLAALDTRVTSYARVQRNITGIRRVLSNGNTIVFGISVYQSFESDKVARTGMVPMPSLYDDLLGGHAVLMVGYDHDRQLIECRNSWSDGWGDEGYFWLPYEYVLDADLSDDFWTLKTVTEAA
jgi:C1A family cysteine protease